MAMPPRALRGRLAASVIAAVLGSNRREFALAGALLVVSISWFADILREIITNGPGTLAKNTFDLILLSAFPLTALILYRLAALTLREGAEAVRIVTDEWPAKVKVLLLFLSPPGMTKAQQEALSGDLADPAQQGGIIERFGRASWRMPFEAISYHLPALERVVVIPSRAEHWMGRYQKIDIPGTAEHAPDFIELACRLTPTKPVLVQEVASFLADESLRSGIGFYNPQEIADVCNRCLSLLRRHRFRDHEILIDATGGYTVTTAAAAAATIAHGRRFQCVDMHGYRVRSFDISYGDAE
jgi:hypothetical protein